MPGRGPTSHEIFGTSQWPPEDFASQMNVSLSNGFGIVKAIVDVVRRGPCGMSYVLLKDHMKPVLRLYAIPALPIKVDSHLSETEDDEL